MIKTFFKNQKASFYIHLVIIILQLIPLVYMFQKMIVFPDFLPAIIFSFLAIAAEIAVIFVPVKPVTDGIQIVSTIFSGLSFAFFFAGGVLSIVDKVFGIVFWGDPTQVPAIIAYLSILGVACCCSVVNCFIKD